MLKWARLLAATLFSLILLAACGTTAQESKKNTGNGENKTEQNTTEKEAKNSEEPESAKEKEKNDAQVSDKIRLMEMNLSYEVNGSKKEETAFLKESDNLDYSLYLLPEYELTGEEPYTDVLYYKENDSHFMRIELLPGDVTMDDAAANVREQLESVGQEVKQIKDENGNQWLADARIYQFKKNNELVTAYLVEKKDWILKVTIFTTTEENHLDPFLKMAETIEKK
ncbi:hypothetical protein [Lederbergia citrea]|uniref:hypothetical protein n=1 Tax=Lederbergia citrea TaxID=2833581 RepID=UPI001BC93E26|nr:hypothetical protein [Lederbergia citrea]MBS4177314.1 hypothetical protein [Lederbergia citrea]